MSGPPEGAQISDDGHYWWDGSAWQPVDDSGEAPAASAGGDTWPPAGYPEDPSEWTDEQLQYWFGSTQDASEDSWAVEPQQIQVAEIQGYGNGEA
jgi:hypothetical protein